MSDEAPKRRAFSMKVPVLNHGDQHELDEQIADAVTKFDDRFVLVVRQDGFEQSGHLVDHNDRPAGTIVLDQHRDDDTPAIVIPIADIRRIEIR